MTTLVGEVVFFLDIVGDVTFLNGDEVIFEIFANGRVFFFVFVGKVFFRASKGVAVSDCAISSGSFGGSRKISGTFTVEIDFTLLDSIGFLFLIIFGSSSKCSGSATFLDRSILVFLEGGFVECSMSDGVVR